MLPPAAANDLTSTPKKILRLSQTKADIDQAHALEQSISPVVDDDRDEIASNTSVAVRRTQIFVISNKLSLDISLSLESIRIFEENLASAFFCLSSTLSF